MLVPYEQWRAIQRQHAELFQERRAKLQEQDVSLEDALNGLIEREKLPADYIETGDLADANH